MTSPQQPAASRKPPVDFDDRLWPINLALLVLAGFIAGVIVAKSDFQTPLVLSNGYLHLGVLAAIVGVLLWGVARFGARVQRRLQLGVFVSLLVHFWLCMLSYNVYLSLAARDEPDAAEQFEEPQIVTLPDYHWQDQRQAVMTDESIEAPLETELPEAESKPVEQSRTEPTPIERPSETEPAARQREPSPVELERAEMAPPHRAEQLSGQRLSRSESESRLPAEQVETPQVAEAEQSAAMKDRVEAIDRQATNPAAQSRGVQPTEPSSRRSPDQAQIERRAPAERPAPSATSAPQPERRLASAPSESPERIHQPAQPSPERAAAQSLSPRAADVARQAQRADPTRPTASAPAGEARPDVAAARRQQSASQPQLDSLAAAARSRATSEANAAANPQVQIPADSARPAAKSQPLAPSPTDAARSAASNPAALARPESMAPSASQSRPLNVEPLSPGRASSENSPATTPVQGGASPSQVARSRASAAAPSESVAFDAPNASSAPQANDSPSQPAATGATKASGGASGLTRQRNFDSALPGAGQLSHVPAVAARRATASQQTAPGSAASPNEPARIAKARAGADSPSAALAAEDVSVADAAGSRDPRRIEASSSASLERSAANAPQGRVSADAGSAPLDLGSPRIASTIGDGRASGGGEPTLGEMHNPARIAKSASAVEPPDAAAMASAGNSQPSNPSNATNSASGDAAAPEVGGIARGEQALPAARPGDSGPPAGAANRALAAASPGELRRAEMQTPGGASASGNLGGAALARSASTAETNGTNELAELPPGTAAAGSAASVSGDRGNPAEHDTPQAPGLDGAELQVASSPANSLPIGAGVPGGSNNVAEAGGSRLAAPPAGAAGAPRRSDRLEGAAASLAGASGGVMPRGASPEAAAAGGDATIDLAEIASPSDGAAESAAGPSPRDALAARSDLPAGRMASAGLPVRIAAPAGPGGLASQPSVELGLPSRRARPESEVVHTAAGRILVERSGGKLADVRVRDTAVPGLRQRDRATRRELARQRGGSESSERAVEMGLDFLARHQNPDGSWSIHDFSQGQGGYENAGFGRMQSDTAATGLSMLAFLGAGYTHTDGKYRLVVGRGLGFLVGNQREDGDLFLPQDPKSNQNVWLYSHGIAAIALCEAYGMTRDPALRDPAQRALDFIVAAQSPSEGGWRYSPRQGSDTSVSGWQLMALKSGELAGLNAPQETYRRVEAWLDGAQARENPALYAYRPKAKQDHQRLPSRVMTAEGLLMRQYLGWKRDNPFMLAGADYLLGHLPQWDGAYQRDAYYWYYATQVMFQIGGEHWQQWNDRLRELLIQRQTADGALAGSWDPLGPSPDRWGREAGRLYITAMHLLMLEVYYRHLPLYRNLEGEGAEE